MDKQADKPKKIRFGLMYRAPIEANKLPYHIKKEADYQWPFNNSIIIGMQNMQI